MLFVCAYIFIVCTDGGILTGQSPEPKGPVPATTTNTKLYYLLLTQKIQQNKTINHTKIKVFCHRGLLRS